MIIRRILYLLALVSALLFKILSENYWGHFLLYLCAALPLLSLALSLPGMCRARVRLTAMPFSPERGGEARFEVSVRVPGPLPAARITLRCAEENLLWGQTTRRRLTLTGVLNEQTAPLPASTGHCGLLELRVERARMFDLLGLFSLPLKKPAPARMLCRPRAVPTQPPAGMQQDTALPGAPRARSAEDCELRGYRPGDAMRAVHWKLSAKWDELIVREPALLPAALPLLAFDRAGAPDALDALLDRLLGLSRALLGVQRAHAILWLDADGAPQSCLITDASRLEECLLALLGSRAPARGPSVGTHPLLKDAAARAVYISTASEGGGDHV